MKRSALALSAFLAALVLPHAVRADFNACLARLRSQAVANGISAATFAAATQGIRPDGKVLELMGHQPEFKTPIWDYIAMLVDEERVADGRAAMRDWGAALAAAEARYGVDRHVLAAVWGVESNYGKDKGEFGLVQSLATLACHGGRRRNYFGGELMAALHIVQRGDIKANRLTGSWAGAFGHTQFMPSTFRRLAVDLDGDGRRDVMDSVPDALGSTANFLRKARWSPGLAWGCEVRLPAGIDARLAGRRRKRPAANWAAMGITCIDGRPVNGLGAAGLILPAGPRGPAFLVTKNFDALYAYNAAESYGLAIAVLSDRLRGGPGIRTPWPTDDRGLSRAERRELMRLLASHGYDVGEPNGRIGARTQAAIREVERRIGMTPTGRAGGRLLDALRRTIPAAGSRFMSPRG
jgi:lytic murein transglycosylase